jgi:hypothetical protein
LVPKNVKKVSENLSEKGKEKSEIKPIDIVG